MGGVCSCFGPRNNATSSNRHGRPHCWRCPTCVYRNINNYLVTGSLTSNTTTIEKIKLESQPKKECIVVLNPKNFEEKSDEDRLKHVFSSWEDEDVCPTCFEDYTLENPKIIANCSHHYHLGCIYDWMERSKNCPMCGKLMEFEGIDTA